MAFTVVYDACVLYPSTLRDLLIRIAQAGLVQAKWTDRILDEVFTNLHTNRPELNPAKLARTRELMMRAVRDCLVKDHEPLESALQLPDTDDRHVLAAAIKAQAQLIVTHNLKDFPEEALAPWNIEAVSADDFVLAQIDLDRQRVFAAVQQIADSWRNPPGTTGDVLGRLERDGLLEATAALRSGQ
ncbi:PIN domain-containing protein [Streptomyces sp. WMMC897]|uniref:PIN domain-containing protein n=1 Tax=Streptomyces sp. WMMC897 TaxID=3014782 RepID=UPI0022B619B8|nr:PIN domain-containing protein [Streptomyces sp. WMMC897]MCZ7415136.1 PIN domain-containing protein [Streptomyces sp. WMMC897]